MFLKSVTELELDFDDVRAAMLDHPHAWLAGLAAAAGDDGDRLLVDVGLQVGGHEVSHRARLELGRPMTTDRVVLLPLQVRFDDHQRLLPSLDGSLDLAWLGPGRTHLALTVTYEPPFGIVGQAVDRTLLHRVAEAVAQRFLESVARELEAGGTNRPAGQRPHGPAAHRPGHHPDRMHLYAVHGRAFDLGPVTPEGRAGIRAAAELIVRDELGRTAPGPPVSERRSPCSG